jgi:hypothetical protein
MSTINYDDLIKKLNTTLVIHDSFGKSLAEVRRAVTHAGRYDDPQVFVLLGESRAGKTRVLETIEAEHQASRSPDARIMPIVRIRVPKGASTKGVLSLILDAMGDQFSSSGTETAKLIRLLRFVERLQVKVIVIDEFQHLVRFSKRSEFDTADALKVLADLASVNLVVSGLTYAKALIDANPQLAGRSRQPVILNRFNWNLPSDRAEFIAIVAAFAEMLNPIRFPDFDDEEWGFRWYCATGGLVGYVSKIFKEILDKAEDAQAGAVTLEDMDAAQQTVFTKDTSSALRPFSRTFSTDPSVETMRFALSIGRIDDENAALPATA